MNLDWCAGGGVMGMGSTLTFVTINSKLLMVQNECTVVYLEQGSAKGDYCVYVKPHSGLLQRAGWCWELLQHLSQSTVKYWWCNMDVEWFTLENGMLMETTLTCTRTLCGPLGAQDEFTVVYCRMWDGAGSYFGTHHRGQ